MKTLTFNIPESIDLDEKEARTFFAAKLYELGTLRSCLKLKIKQMSLRGSAKQSSVLSLVF